MITDPRSSLTEMRSSRNESSFLAETPLIKLVGAANCQSPPNTLKQELCTTGTPRLGCVLTNAIYNRPFDLRTRRTTSTRFDLKFLGFFSKNRYPEKVYCAFDSQKSWHCQSLQKEG